MLEYPIKTTPIIISHIHIPCILYNAINTITTMHVGFTGCILLKLTKPIISMGSIIQIHVNLKPVIYTVLVIGKRKKAAFKWCMTFKF